MLNYFKDVYKNPLFLIWIIFFSISPVYWFPSFPIGHLEYFKKNIFLFAIFFSVFILLKNQIFLFPSKNKGIIFFIIFLISLLPGLNNTNPYQFSEFHDKNLSSEVHDQ